MKARFRSPAALDAQLKKAGFDLLVTQTESGQLTGSLQLERISNGMVLQLRTDKPLHFYGDKKASMLTVPSNSMSFHGRSAQSCDVGGFNQQTMICDCFVPAGGAITALLMDPALMEQKLREGGNEHALHSLSDAWSLRMTHRQRNRFMHLLHQGLDGSGTDADDALVEFDAIASKGSALEFDLDDRSVLSRAVEVLCSTLSDPMFDGQDLARLALTNERWLRKQFRRYGTSPMAFRRHMRLSMVQSFVRTEEATAMTQKQLAEKFGFAKPKWLGQVYRQHFGENLFDIHRSQIEMPL